MLLLYTRRLMLPLPKKTPEGVVVLLGRFGIYDPHKYDMSTINRMGTLVCDLVNLEDEEVTVTGFILLNDAAGITLSHMASFTPVLAKKAAVLMQVEN